MSKYIDAEKLIDAIEKRMEDYNVVHNEYVRYCFKILDIEILSIIDSLQQEQLKVDLSEETLIEEFHTIKNKCFNEGIEGWQREKLIARHFYELGLNARKEG